VGSHGWISASTSVELPPGVCKATACMFVAGRNQTDLPTPTWPSLYDPLIEFHNLEHHAPVQPGGRYLTHARDVFRFTFYWTLVFHSVFFLITGGIACFNIIYPSRRDKNGVSPTRNCVAQPAPQSHPHPHPMIPLTPLASARSPDLFLPEPSEPPETVGVEEPRAPQPRRNVHRSRFTYAIFTLLAFLLTALAASLVRSAVVGYILWAVFNAGDFNISTWLPLVWALIITSSVVLSAFPSVIDQI